MLLVLEMAPEDVEGVREDPVASAHKDFVGRLFAHIVVLVSYGSRGLSRENGVRATGPLEARVCGKPPSETKWSFSRQNYARISGEVESGRAEG